MQEIIKSIDKMFLPYLPSEQTERMKKKWIVSIESDCKKLESQGESSDDIKKYIHEKYGLEIEDFTMEAINRPALSQTEIVAEKSYLAPKGGSVYKLLKEHCNVICFNKPKEGLPFTCDERFVVFATDGNGGYYGFIGGSGHTNDKDAPIGFVSYLGKCGRIARNLREFLELVVYIPFWQDVNLKYINKGLFVEDLETRYVRNNTNYYKNQIRIANTLGLQKNERSLDLLYENLEKTPRFIVYDIQDRNSVYDSMI